mmetsp:Transcript_6959/g.20103  ORF Transcript_6959/g.20103 Transcript_6959/m.20103 type:complete len:308 (-) Transcript_6959:426-1349(-)
MRVVSVEDHVVAVPLTLGHRIEGHEQFPGPLDDHGGVAVAAVVVGVLGLELDGFGRAGGPRAAHHGAGVVHGNVDELGRGGDHGWTGLCPRGLEERRHRPQRPVPDQRGEHGPLRWWHGWGILHGLAPRPGCDPETPVLIRRVAPEMHDATVGRDDQVRSPFAARPIGHVPAVVLGLAPGRGVARVLVEANEVALLLGAALRVELHDNLLRVRELQRPVQTRVLLVRVAALQHTLLVPFQGPRQVLWGPIRVVHVEQGLDQCGRRCQEALPLPLVVPRREGLHNAGVKVLVLERHVVAPHDFETFGV